MTYYRPDTLSKALRLIALPDLRILAGGTDVFAGTLGGQVRGNILDITGVDELSGITRTNQGWRIGATTTWADIINANLPDCFDALKQAAREVGSLQIQNTATVAGNLCNASPAADGVPPLLILDAKVELMSVDGVRHVALADFLTGVRQIDLRHTELVSAVIIPTSATAGRSAFTKLGARKYLVISIAMVAVRLEFDTGAIGKAAVAVGACGPVATRLPALELALIGKSGADPTVWSQALSKDIARTLDPITDIRGDAAYRLDAAHHLITRTILRLARTAA